MTEIDKTKVYEFLTSQVAASGAASLNAFKWYVQVCSAIVGGSIWLSLGHSLGKDARELYEKLSNGAVLILTVLVTAIVLDSLRSWRSYRNAVAKLGTGVGFSKPSLFSVGIEAALLFGIWVVYFMFQQWNPFTLSN